MYGKCSFVFFSSLAKQYGQGSSSSNGGSGSGGVEALVYSVDIDELAEVAVAHDVSTLPRLLFFKVHGTLSYGLIYIININIS